MPIELGLLIIIGLVAAVFGFISDTMPILGTWTFNIAFLGLYLTLQLLLKTWELTGSALYLFIYSPISISIIGGYFVGTFLGLLLVFR